MSDLDKATAEAAAWRDHLASISPELGAMAEASIAAAMEEISAPYKLLMELPDDATEEQAATAWAYFVAEHHGGRARRFAEGRELCDHEDEEPYDWERTVEREIKTGEREEDDTEWDGDCTETATVKIGDNEPQYYCAEHVAEHE